MLETLIRGNVELAALLDNLPDAIVRVDRDLRYRYANRAAETMFGVAREALIGRTKVESGTLPPAAHRAWDEKCRTVVNTRQATGYSFSCMTGGRLRHYSIRIVPEFGTDGAVETVLSIARDIPERKCAEDALRRSDLERNKARSALRKSEERLHQLREEHARAQEGEQRLRLEAEAVAFDAHAASRIKDDFLANLSHELRTPLNAILGWTQTLQAGNTKKETVLRGLLQIEQSAQAQANLIDDLLNVSDIIAGRLRLDLRPMCLTPAINASIETLYPAINSKGIRLETQFDLDADVITGDPARVRQFMSNLLSNAVKFTPRHGKIRVALFRAGSHATIAVSDSGRGITPEFLPYVFDRFRQGDASTRKPHGGLGLGLAIARHLVEMHGGTIEAHSEGAGRGSTITVRMPLEAIMQYAVSPASHAVGRSDSVSAVTPRRSLAGLRVLTVDDDRNTRDMLEEALANAGAEVYAAASARDALDKLQRFRPDVLVSDIGMPDEDGWDLLQQVRVLPPDRGGATPAIALTGYAREEDRAASRDAGYQAVATKPVNLDELLSTILDVAAQPAR